MFVMKKMIGFLLITLSLSCGVFAQENNFITEGIKMHDKGDYEGAIQFYKKNGFVEFDKHIFTLGNDKQTDIMMKLKL